MCIDFIRTSEKPYSRKRKEVKEEKDREVTEKDDIEPLVNQVIEKLHKDYPREFENINPETLRKYIRTEIEKELRE